MQRVEFGRTGMRLSRIGFGGIPIQRLAEEDAVSVLRRAMELGIDWFDTAHGYGTSEERIGKALAGRPGGSVRVFTKAPGKTPEELKKQVEASFSRLRVPVIDLYQFHLVGSPEEWARMRSDGCLEVLLGYKARGRILHLGASAHRKEAALAVLDVPEIESIQWPFHFMAEADGLEVLAKARGRGAGFIAMKAFGGGMLDDAGACLRFLLQHPDVLPDPGFEKASEVEEAVRIAEGDLRVTEKDRAAMERMRRALGNGFCRRCGYCSPCPEGVAIVTLMTAESLLRRFDRAHASSMWGPAADTVDRCTACGACEKKCPYELSIRERIRVGARVLREARGMP